MVVGMRHAGPVPQTPQIPVPPVNDLQQLISTMRPVHRPGRFVFTTSRPGQAPEGVEVQASVREEEGLSLVLTQQDADRAGLDYDYVAGWITLTVHSALEAVGLTAAVSTALAQVGISCNVIAGLHHDHLLVDVERAQDAIDALEALSGHDPGA